LLYTVSGTIFYSYTKQDMTDSEAQDSVGIQPCGQAQEKGMWIFLAGLGGVRESLVLVGDNER
jgi:hypothetical protein